MKFHCYDLLRILWGAIGATVLEGRIVDPFREREFLGRVVVCWGRIIAVLEDSRVDGKLTITLGLVDGHRHVESSTVPPEEEARILALNGVVASVSDPHEIANVLGLQGVYYMLEGGARAMHNYFFGAPSCVPALGGDFETAGATIDLDGLKTLGRDKRIWYLAELMNYPAVINNWGFLREAVAFFRLLGKPADGHFPDGMGEEARIYAMYASTNHENSRLEAALEQLRHGMKFIQIREGSAAKNFEALWTLLRDYPHRVMFATDDGHPDYAIDFGQICHLVRRAVLEKGVPLMNAIRAATRNPIEHYKLPIGRLRLFDPANLVMLGSDDLRVVRTYVKGRLVADWEPNGVRVTPEEACLIPRQKAVVINNFHAEEIAPAQLQVPARGTKIRCIQAIDGQIVTDKVVLPAAIRDGLVVTDVDSDVLKIVVYGRYSGAKLFVGFIRGFGLKTGAIASSVAHDSHNIVAIGVSDEEIANAINMIVRAKGGLAAVDGSFQEFLPLPIAGIMSDDDVFVVAAKHRSLDRFAKRVLGAIVGSPFMLLSFMALPVIKKFKITDKCLVDIGDTGINRAELFEDAA